MNIKTPSAAQMGAIKALLFVLCAMPALLLAQGWFNNTLGANPIEAVTHTTGEWTLRMLLITLAVTPLRRLTGLHWLLRVRRQLGLFAFAYASMHFATYMWLDLYFDWNAIALDIIERPFVTVGFAAFVLLIPLAVTSTQAAIRRMGGRKWLALHRSVYAIAILGIIHYWWLVKADVFKPVLYALILVALLGARAWWRELERRRQIAAMPPMPAFKGKVIRIMPK